MKYLLMIVFLICLMSGGFYLLFNQSPTAAPEVASDASATSATTTELRHEIGMVTYECDKDKHLTATYYDGPEPPPVLPDEPPQPTGSVDVELDGGATLTLQQTISADGIRYANENQSFVFWSKGDTALVMRNNEMDLAYTNCVAQ